MTVFFFFLIKVTLCLPPCVMSCVFTNRPHPRFWGHKVHCIWSKPMNGRIQGGGAKVSRYWNRILESFPPSVSNASVDIYCASMNRRENKNRDPAISALVTLITSWIASALGRSPRALCRERIRLVFHERSKATIRHIKAHKKKVTSWSSHRVSSPTRSPTWTCLAGRVCTERCASGE